VNNPVEYVVIMKHHGRAVQQAVVKDAGTADEMARIWYQQGDGRTYEIQSRSKVAEQVEPQISRDRYLTQESGEFWPIGRLFTES